MVAVTEDLVRLYTASDAVKLGALVRAGEVTPAELVETAITVIDRVNPGLNAVIHKLYDIARAHLPLVPADGALAGVPYLMKELGTLWQGAPLTNSCAWAKDVLAPADSEMTRRVKAAGLVLVGKSNAPENGWAITTEPKLYGVTHNPWRADVTPGGSSGGSAAAVAARLVPLAESSDGAGSIRVPASCCGVIGLKPSRGRVTQSPASDFWHGGTYVLCNSRTVRDTAAFLDAVAGALPGDPYQPPRPTDSWLRLAGQAPARLRIGFTVTPPGGAPIDAEAVAAVRRTAGVLEGLGHHVEEHDLRVDLAEGWRVYTRMTPVESAGLFDLLEPLVGRPVTQADVEPITWAIIQAGRARRATDYAADVQALRVLSRAIATELNPYDVYLTPTLTQKPRPLGYWNMNETDLERYNARWTDAVFMYPFNVSGQPAISLPLHWSADGLPIGVQLVARDGDEATLLALASVLEDAMPWRERRPQVSAG